MAPVRMSERAYVVLKPSAFFFFFVLLGFGRNLVPNLRESTSFSIIVIRRISLGILNLNVH